MQKCELKWRPHAQLDFSRAARAGLPQSRAQNAIRIQWGSRPMIKRSVLIAAIVGLAACGERSGIKGYDAIAQHVEGSRVGRASDHWIERQSLSGSWERVGLVFGYMDDRQACLDAIAGMKAADPDREYTCVPAN